MLRLLLITVMTLFLGVGHVTAQDDDACAVIVESVVERAVDSCASAGRNEACYGNGRLDATFWEPESDQSFLEPADRVPLSAIRALTAAPFNAVLSQWGVAILNVQANLPDTLPGQAVTFVLMGDVSVENVVAPDEAEGVDSGSDQEGNGDPNRFRAMQAIYFSTGIGQPECKAAPDALFIRSPDSHVIDLQINNINIVLGSSVLFTSTQLASGVDVLVGTLLEGAMETHYEAFTLTLSEPGQSFAVTLNSAGLADENSELVDIAGNAAIEDAVASGCATIALTPEWGAGLPPCEDLAITYVFAQAEPPAEVSLDDVGADDPCTIAAFNTANLRDGPGADYAWSGQLAQNDRDVPVAIATGTDGVDWWKLPNDLWIRADLVNQAGACGAVPVIEAAPPTPPPDGDVGERQYEIAFTCADMNQIRVGDTVTFQVGIGRWETVGEMNDALAAESATFTLDGVALTTYYEGPTWHTGGGDAPGYGDRARADWTATRGTHTVTGGWTLYSETQSCTFTVE